MNDAVLCITRLLREPQLFERVAYIDLDVHHGDGVQVRELSGTGYRSFNIQFSEKCYAELALNFTFLSTVCRSVFLSFLPCRRRSFGPTGSSPCQYISRTKTAGMKTRTKTCMRKCMGKCMKMR